MATTPRYLGTTVSAAKTYAQEALTSEVFLQVFDMDRDGQVAAASADETSFSRSVARVETTIDEILGASHGAPFTADAFAALPEGTRDAIKSCGLEMLPWETVKFRPSMSDEKKAPYRTLWKDAVARLERLAKDHQRRLPGSVAAAPTPVAGLIAADEDDAGATWQNIANGTLSV